MKNRLFIILCGLFAPCMGIAQTSNTSHEGKSSKDTGTSTATWQVKFDAAGNKSVLLTKSTGSKVLDDRMYPHVAEYMNGPRSMRVTISIPYKSVKVATGHAVLIASPRPPYPYQARARHEQGSGMVKASFDEAGNAVSAEMAQSTGSKVLDGNTVNYVLTRWKSSGAEKVTTTFPIDYRLQ